jgi:hypothetical protein
MWKEASFQKLALKEVLKRSGKRRYEQLTARDFTRHGAQRLLALHKGLPTLFRAILKSDYHPSKALPGSFRFESRHGHLFKSDEECRLDDILSEDFGLQAHRHNIRYPSSEMTCDFVCSRRGVWIEYAGMVGKYAISRAWRARVSAYRRKLRLKQTIARRHGIVLVIIYPSDLNNRKRFEKKLGAYGLKRRASPSN